MHRRRTPSLPLQQQSGLLIAPTSPLPHLTTSLTVTGYTRLQSAPKPMFCVTLSGHVNEGLGVTDAQILLRDAKNGRLARHWTHSNSGKTQKIAHEVSG
jgi:hypothetical protein